ncbi:ABC transporter permease subunit [Govanella unica]|uniref:ABC transporter permease subunit n=1 Tax=Govanella unica TaxID=2975056 RepID=A0A9X3TW84_9PROT|nr:ABC transporter permease subunit [Govania unica]MDA5192898.1 ABC transporter permease subunit [Govania unica]
MIGVIARKEFLCLIRDGRFKWSIAIMVLLLLASFLTGFQRYQSLHSIREAAQAKNTEQWLDQDKKNPHTAAHFGNYAYKPQGVLAFFDSGIDNYAGNTIWLEAHKTNFAQNRPAQDNGAVSRFGDLTPAMTLQVLLPLIIILMGFSAFAGERDSGTLRQLLSIGVKNSDLLWGKFIGISAAISLVIVPAVLIGGGIMAFVLDSDSSALGARGLLLLGTYLAYTLSFMFLTLGVSALARTGKTALVILVGFWAFATFILPKAASDISKIAVPSPTFSEFYKAAKASSAEGLEGAEGRLALPQDVHINMVRKELLAQYNVKSVRDLPVYWVGISMQVLEERDYLIYQKFQGDLRDIFYAQQKLQDYMGVLSPLIPLRSLSMSLSGTGLVDQEQFNQSAQDYRINMIRDMNNELINNTTMKDPLYVAGRETFSKVPPYTYAEPTLGQSLATQTQSLVLLVLWGALTAIFAVFAVRRLRS